MNGVTTSEPIPKLIFESMDGSVILPIDGTMGWIRMPGSTGLEMPPVEVITSPTPGVAGSARRDVRVQERPIFIPLYGRSDTSQQNYRELRDQLRSLVDPTTGTFKVVGTTSRGAREMVVTYLNGLEGADGADVEGLSWCKVGLNLVAHQPFAQARTDRVMEFRMQVTADPFLGVVGGTDTPWPDTMLSSSSVIGDGMGVLVESEVPVYPILELTGFMDFFSGALTPVDDDDSEHAWSVTIPLGVPAGSTFRMVTDPLQRSIRLDGALAAGKVERGSKLRPFQPGLNILNVTASGGTEDTVIRLIWREMYWSLW